MSDKAVTPQTLNQLKNLWKAKRIADGQIEALESRKNDLNKQMTTLELVVRDNLELTHVSISDLEVGKVVAYQRHEKIILFEIAAWGYYGDEDCLVTSTDNFCYHVSDVRNIL